MDDTFSASNDLLAEVGQHLRQWRQYRGRTQAEVAAMVGITQASLSNYERGARDANISTVLALAGALEVSPGDLLATLPPDAVRPPRRMLRVPRTYSGPQLLAALNTLVEHLADESDEQLEPPAPRSLRPLEVDRADRRSGRGALRELPRSHAGG